jgi:hypothetical protein
MCRPLGRPRRRWEDNIKMDLRERRWGGMDWIDLAQDRDQWRALVNTAMNLRVPQNAGKFLGSRTTGGFSGTAQLHGVSVYMVCHYCSHVDGHSAALCSKPNIWRMWRKNETKQGNEEDKWKQGKDTTRKEWLHVEFRRASARIILFVSLPCHWSFSVM